MTETFDFPNSQDRDETETFNQRRGKCYKVGGAKWQEVLGYVNYLAGSMGRAHNRGPGRRRPYGAKGLAEWHFLCVSCCLKEN